MVPPSAPPNDLGRCVAGLMNAVAKGTARQLAPFSIIPVEYTILSVCFTGQADTVTGLARVIPVDAGRISRLVNRLSERGLIHRRRLRSDRRTVRLTLTQEGRMLVPKLARRVQTHNAMLLAGISAAEMNAFFETAQKILANFAGAEPGKQNPQRTNEPPGP